MSIAETAPTPEKQSFSTLANAHEWLSNVKGRLGKRTEEPSNIRFLRNKWFNTRFGRFVVFFPSIVAMIGVTGCAIIQPSEKEETNDARTELVMEVETPHQTFEMPADQEDWEYLYEDYTVMKEESWHTIISEIYGGRYPNEVINYIYAEKVLRLENGTKVNTNLLHPGDKINIPALLSYEENLVDNMYQALGAIPALGSSDQNQDSLQPTTTPNAAVQATRAAEQQQNQPEHDWVE